MGLFLVGMGIVLSTWMKAGPDRRTLGGLLRDAFGTIFSARLGLLIRTFVTEAWFNRRLWRTSLWRWLNHFLLLTGFVLLMTLSGISALSDKVLIHFFHLEHVGWISMWVTPDHPITGLLNEIGGVMMTLGFLFFVVRRYLSPPSQLRTGPMDTGWWRVWARFCSPGGSPRLCASTRATWDQPPTLPSWGIRCPCCSGACHCLGTPSTPGCT
jgi:hypothetical protein